MWLMFIEQVKYLLQSILVITEHNLDMSESEKKTGWNWGTYRIKTPSVNRILGEKRSWGRKMEQSWSIFVLFMGFSLIFKASLLLIISLYPPFYRNHHKFRVSGRKLACLRYDTLRSGTRDIISRRIRKPKTRCTRPKMQLIE